MRFPLPMVVAGVLLAGCGKSEAPAPKMPELPKKIQLTSPAFAAGAAIPAKYTADGQNVSPPLAWANLPAGTKELALIVDDPDAPESTFVHWVLYKIPPTATPLPEGIPQEPKVALDMLQGRNSFSRTGYDGPAPPRGQTHHYYFRLYALKEPVSLAPNITKDELIAAIHTQVLDMGELMGTYKRP